MDPVQLKLSERGSRVAFLMETMLRIRFMKQWSALSDPGMEEALHDIPALRAFAGPDAGSDLIPDESSILRFRHCLNQHGLADPLLAEVNALLSEQGLLLRQRTIVDATLSNAPSSTKNQDRARDPVMHSAKKGNQWYFGIKDHIGVDAESGLTHTVVTTSANVNDVTQAHACLHGHEADVFGDASYQGAAKRPEKRDRPVAWHVAMKPGQRKVLSRGRLGQLLEALEHTKASLQAKVEHPFRIIKRQFGYSRTHYRGLQKNTAQLVTLFALANLFQARHRFKAAGAVRLCGAGRG